MQERPQINPILVDLTQQAIKDLQPLISGPNFDNETYQKAVEKEIKEVFQELQNQGVNISQEEVETYMRAELAEASQRNVLEDVAGLLVQALQTGDEDNQNEAANVARSLEGFLGMPKNLSE